MLWDWNESNRVTPTKDGEVLLDTNFPYLALEIVLLLLTKRNSHEMSCFLFKGFQRNYVYHRLTSLLTIFDLLSRLKNPLLNGFHKLLSRESNSNPYSTSTQTVGKDKTTIIATIVRKAYPTKDYPCTLIREVTNGIGYETIDGKKKVPTYASYSSC